ncbi:MAG: hypothetical protein KIT22_00425 [Verrucomicrobiae bacterium]|nr:hypothetical protein [Verrucomicrobiae bacterium]
MPTPPLPDKRARTGSNVRSGEALTALEESFRGKAGKLTREQRDLRARFRKLFSKADLRVAAQLIARARRSLHAANLESGSDTAAWDANKARVRNRLERELKRVLPGYREWRALVRTRLRGAPRSGADSIAFAPGLDIHIDFDDIAPASAGVQVFTAPFDAEEAFTSTWITDTSIPVRDRSFHVSAIGHFVNDLDFTFSDDGDFEEVLGINVRASVLSWAACGINFKVPETGRLRMTARVRNFYNHVLLTVRDQVGFSESTLEVDIDLYFDVLVNGDIKDSLHTQLLHHRISSGGGEHTYLMPDLDTDAPYVIHGESLKTYELGQKIQILVGCRIAIDSEIDDMTTHVRPLLWWKLEELTVEMFNVVIL